jgi:calcineurin-like phosphoesterase family protein
MDDIYLVEIRLARTHWKIKETITSLAGYFGVRDSMELHPHVTLFGPFTLHEGIPAEEILDLIGRCAAPYDPLPFTIGEWEKREGLHGGVIAFSVFPSDALRKLTRGIADALLPRTVSNNHWDSQLDKKWFHITVANWLEPKKSAEMHAELIANTEENAERDLADPGTASCILCRLAAFLWRREPVQLPPSARPLLLDETGLRITVMHGQEIFAEYDLMQKRWIRGAELHDPDAWKRTVSEYRKDMGFELVQPAPSHPGDIYLISDLHLGHENIIRYCSRPFVYPDAAEMDRVLIQNWNCTIAPGDLVCYLGDLRFGKQAPPAVNYREQLNGDITNISGNHDDKQQDAIPSKILEYGNYTFLLVHDPADAPCTFDGWVIHGHHHNNDLRHYPFVNFEKRRINVSVEVLGYTPVGIMELVNLIGMRESSGNREPILLRYPYSYWTAIHNKSYCFPFT